MDSIVFKVKYGDTVRRFTASTIASNGTIFPDMQRLREKILVLFNFASEEEFSLKYIDEDNEKISLVDDEDLYEAFRQYLNPLRIFVSNKTFKAKSRRSKFMLNKSRNYGTICSLRAEKILKRSQPLTLQASLHLVIELVKASNLIIDSLVPKVSESSENKDQKAEYFCGICEPNEFEDEEVGEEKKSEQGNAAKIKEVSVLPIDLNLDPATSDLDMNFPGDLELCRLLGEDNQSIMMEVDDVGKGADHMELNNDHASVKNFNNSDAASIKNPVVEASTIFNSIFTSKTRWDEFDKSVLDLNLEFKENETPLNCYSEEALQEAKGENMDQELDIFDDNTITSDDAEGKNMKMEIDNLDDSSITSDDAEGKNMEKKIDSLDDSSITSDDAKERNMDQESSIFDDNSVTSDDFDRGVDSSDVEHESPLVVSFAGDDFPSSERTEIVNEEAILNKLVEMGFSKTSLTEEILKLNDYNIEHSIDYLCGNSDWDLMLEDLLEIKRNL